MFARRHGRVELTEKGEALWHASQTAFQEIESKILRLREQETRAITLGVSTYFASRWLSPRLMTFIESIPTLA